MNMTDISNLIGNLRTKRSQVSKDLSSLSKEAKATRERISNLEKERVDILATPVTKADYIEAVLRGIDSLGASYPVKLAGFIHNTGGAGIYCSVGALDSARDSCIVNKNLLTCDPHLPVDITFDALYFIFAGEIKRAVQKALEEKLPWNPPKTISFTEARARIAAIDAELAELKERLDGFIETAKSFAEEV